VKIEIMIGCYQSMQCIFLSKKYYQETFKVSSDLAHIPINGPVLATVSLLSLKWEKSLWFDRMDLSLIWTAIIL